MIFLVMILRQKNYFLDSEFDETPRGVRPLQRSVRNLNEEWQKFGKEFKYFYRTVIVVVWLLTKRGRTLLQN